jgi:hypothetical protein
MRGPTGPRVVLAPITCSAFAIRDQQVTENHTQFKSVDELLGAFHDGRLEQMEFLARLMDWDIWVVLDTPWDGKSALPPGARMLLVSEGDDDSPRMLGLFSLREIAREFMAAAAGYDHLARIPAALALLSVRPDQGAVLNPNRDHGCRIPPAVAAYLRRSIRCQLAAVGEGGTPLPG